MESKPELSDRDFFRLKATLRDMSMPLLQSLSEEYGVEIPIDPMDIFNTVDVFVDGLSLESRRKILDEYGDAGRKSTYLYISKKKTPKIQDIYPKAKALLGIRNESELWEYHPYYDDVQIDYKNRTLKIRFHYLKGIILTLDDTGRQREQHLQHSGVVVYRPESRILEIRTQHKSMANKMAVRIPVYLNLEPFITLSLMDEKLIRSFVDWISSLNSAMIELAISDVAGSLRITARKGMDLRTAEKFNQELKSGRLRGGHVTIERDNNGINFRIYFRDCHIKYTLFTSEEEIAYILDAIEKILEGYKFDRPNKMLSDFFGKKD